MIANNQELYTAVQATCAKLKSGGLESEAEKLHDALTTSTVPGEILGELKLTLDEIVKRKVLPLELATEIQEELRYLSNALNQRVTHKRSF